jgi:hypothetical protein
MAGHEFHSMKREPPGIDPPPKRKGSGTHHKISVPRQKLTHLLASAMAHAEVNHPDMARHYARELIRALVIAKILPDATKPEATK